MEVSTEKLFRVVGEQSIKLLLLEGQLAEARGQLQDAAAEVNRLRGDLAAAQDAADLHEDLKNVP